MTSQITAIIPAVDEPDIDRTIRSLLDQSSVPDRIIVAVNNTSSSVTHQAAARVQDERVEVVDLGSIKGKKAGALNAALTLVSTPLVMVVDADTIVSPDFVRQALETLRTPDIGAVGGIFFGQSPRGWLQWCQAMEYARYGQQVEESRRVMVLTGTAAIIRLQALNDVHQARLRGDLPGHGVYDISAITEDNEMSLALKSCGWRLASPAECQTTTELMGTMKDLQAQRIRWYRGALDNLRAYGWTSVTRRYIMQQIMLTLSVIGFASYLLVMNADTILGQLGWSPLWLGVGVLFALERVRGVWRMGWFARVMAISLLPEMVYALALQVAYVRGVWRHLRGGDPTWHHAAGVRAA